MIFAKLENKKVVAMSDSSEWALWFETSDRTVKKTELSEGRFVSTVFLGINHGFNQWFETMVFDEKWRDEDCRRYQTFEEAEAGHDEMVRKWMSNV